MSHFDSEQLSDTASPNVSYRCNADLGFYAVNDSYRRRQPVRCSAAL